MYPTPDPVVSRRTAPSGDRFQRRHHRAAERYARPVMTRALFCLLVSLAACSEQDPREAPPGPAAATVPTPWTPAAMAHCGSGTPPSKGGGCAGAVEAALAALERGVDPLDAAVAGVIPLEDDPRYNAGIGANVRLDGRTVQMDAAVADSKGRYGAVAAIEKVRNPVLVARAVADTPHRLFAGEGATALARKLGHAEFDLTTPETVEQSRKMMARLVAADPKLPRSWRGFDWRRFWNFDTPPPDGATTGTPEAVQDAKAERSNSDTVGAVVRSADGRFAGALSTGGWTLMLDGRIGDTPLPGAGLYVGPAGAVAGTGRGEKIIDVALARTVYGWLEQGVPAAEAARRGVELLGGEGGLIVMTATESAGAAGRVMAWCARDKGGQMRGSTVDR
jgi:isoaspartyl peptidase/L-asparaginase-like protein (Ntn-hydrolase superfamily)